VIGRRARAEIPTYPEFTFHMQHSRNVHRVFGGTHTTVGAMEIEHLTREHDIQP